MNSSINQFELRKKLQDAFRTGRYMITVTAYRENGRLDHFWAWERFPVDDVIPSLAHIAGKIDEKNTPEADSEPR